MSQFYWSRPPVGPWLSLQRMYLCFKIGLDLSGLGSICFECNSRCPVKPPEFMWKLKRMTFFKTNSKYQTWIAVMGHSRNLAKEGRVWDRPNSSNFCQILHHTRKLIITSCYLFWPSIEVHRYNAINPSTVPLPGRIILPCYYGQPGRYYRE